MLGLPCLHFWEPVVTFLGVVWACWYHTDNLISDPVRVFLSRNWQMLFHPTLESWLLKSAPFGPLPLFPGGTWESKMDCQGLDIFCNYTSSVKFVVWCVQENGPWSTFQGSCLSFCVMQKSWTTSLNVRARQKWLSISDNTNNWSEAPECKGIADRYFLGNLAWAWEWWNKGQFWRVLKLRPDHLPETYVV